MVRNTSQRKKMAKVSRINELLEIMKAWDLRKVDVAFISGEHYDSVRKGIQNPDHVSNERLEKFLTTTKAYIKANPQVFSDLTITEEMNELIK